MFNVSSSTELPESSFNYFSLCHPDSPSFAITRVPGFGIPIHEGMDVSLKCDVDANPPSKVVWLMTNGQAPVLFFKHPENLIF